MPKRFLLNKRALSCSKTAIILLNHTYKAGNTMIKAIIFDLDGTLADTMKDLGTAMNAMLRSYGYKERTRKELTSFINKGARYFVWKSLPDGLTDEPESETVTAAMKIYSENYAKCYLDKTTEYDGITEALTKLKERGIKMGVLSNKPDRFVKEIANKLFPDIFVCAYGQTDLPVKPDPAAAFMVAKELGAAPSECAFVGDSDIDMTTAINAKMLPVGVSWGYRPEECLKEAGAKVIIRKATEFEKLI